MRLRPKDDLNWRTTLKAGAAYCAAVAMICLFAAGPCRADSIPAWIDEAITQWNKANPGSQIKFVDIENQWVWYTMLAPAESASKQTRERLYEIAHKNGYVNMKDEEAVTTATPPNPNGPAKRKKCWNRSFLRGAQPGGDAADQSMLSTLVCQDGANWSVGFRLL